MSSRGIQHETNLLSPLPWSWPTVVFRSHPSDAEKSWAVDLPSRERRTVSLYEAEERPERGSLRAVSPDVVQRTSRRFDDVAHRMQCRCWQRRCFPINEHAENRGRRWLSACFDHLNLSLLRTGKHAFICSSKQGFKTIPPCKIVLIRCLPELHGRKRYLNLEFNRSYFSCTTAKPQREIQVVHA